MEFEEGDRIKIEKDGVEYEGVVMPSTTRHIVIKMISGYNAGIDPENASIKVVQKKKAANNTLVAARGPDISVERPASLPKVSILSTGGTIASKIDYRTGAVTASFSADDILQAIPELKEIADFSGRAIYNILSENMKADYWQVLAKAIAEEIGKGADGIIVAHGTDTMMYSAAALSFMIETPVPIVFVGSQRSADRPSSDNAMNAICAALVAVSDIAEVTVVMHDDESDGRCAVHRGTKVRKMHTSRRDAFRSVNADPIAYVDYTGRELHATSTYTKRGARQLELNDSLEPRCALVKFTPGASPEILSYFTDAGYRGLVIEGTGLGHVSTEWIPHIENVIRSGIPVVVTSQCISGRVCNRVYDTGRDILKAGAIEGEDMLPEVALVKLMWALGQSDDIDTVAEIMTNAIAGEISERTLVSACECHE
ncbi:Glu-tRNA(Gln) amidotransferase subunit GatD [Methanolobus halotolerans]|uniref:Glutamyl-tRNA(Gln) amidotransferase subunit D n=1 Tax=Methanolobus halotolerans TaxID=2052935 RepID=A0A4E0QAN4_9EURY|nr:Glu-tRNA(Gln) amidotransferase subunit GatD [Methanolobus halotolerans]TGC09517.1 Glu-tRNA(Gln) amidotransferase GatDE subunit D [Methanolobus halotolerans]